MVSLSLGRKSTGAFGLSGRRSRKAIQGSRNDGEITSLGTSLFSVSESFVMTSSHLFKIGGGGAAAFGGVDMVVGLTGKLGLQPAEMNRAKE